MHLLVMNDGQESKKSIMKWSIMHLILLLCIGCYLLWTNNTLKWDDVKWYWTKRWSALVRHSFIHLILYVSLFSLFYVCITRPILFLVHHHYNAEMMYSTYSFFFAFVHPMNKYIYIYRSRPTIFFDRWWCGCYHHRVPYVNGKEWHASRFDYSLLFLLL